MPITKNSNFKINAQLPIDTRICVDTLTDRDAIIGIQRFKGLICSVKDSDGFGTLANYQLADQVGVIVNNLDWIPFAGGGTTWAGIIDITYANLVIAITASTLVKGSYYRITDYQTIEIISNTTDLNTSSPQYVGTIEPLIVLAEDVNIIGTHALSSLYPQDLIEYDYTKNIEFVTSTPRNGLITYRKDTTLNTDAYYDFRNILNRRWQIDATASNPDSSEYAWTLTPTNPYAINDIAISPTDNNLYINITGNNISDPQGDTTNWTYLLNISTYPYYFASGSNISGNNINLSSSFYDFLTFNGSYQDIHFNLSCSDNIFLDGCYSNTFGDYCGSNTFGYNCNSNTFGDGCYSNTFGDYCGFNTFGYYCYSNTFGYNCNSNTLGDNCNYNIFGYNCYYNTFGDYCYFNTFGYNCYSNTFGNGCNSNTFGYNCYSNTFGNGCNSNTFGDSCGPNTFGTNCYSNTFGYACYSNTLGDYCYYNTFGDGTIYNNFIAIINGMNLSVMASPATQLRFEPGVYNLSSVDFTSATILSGAYNKVVFYNATPAIRMSYYDTNDNLAVVDINN